MEPSHFAYTLSPFYIITKQLFALDKKPDNLVRKPTRHAYYFTESDARLLIPYAETISAKQRAPRRKHLNRCNTPPTTLDSVSVIDSSMYVRVFCARWRPLLLFAQACDARGLRVIVRCACSCVYVIPF